MKYSFIVPVYNGEKYIDRCLKSLLNQTYNNFEIIIINDGSTDNSEKILNEYQKKHLQIKVFHQDNKGLSVSRNIGIKKATGDYILFVDVDDYISNETLAFLESKITKSVDLIKFDWTSNQKELNLELGETKILSGSEALINLIIAKKVFEMAVLYVYKKSFIIKNNIYFKEKSYHEDFGLLPITILKAKEVIVTKKVLYYYDQDVIGSIMNNSDYAKTKKKAFDVLDFYQEIKIELPNIKNVNKLAVHLLKSYNASAVLNKRKTLNKKDKQIYDAKIIEFKVLDDLYTKTIKGKIKKIFYYSLITLFKKN